MDMDMDMDMDMGMDMDMDMDMDTWTHGHMDMVPAVPCRVQRPHLGGRVRICSSTYYLLLLSTSVDVRICSSSLRG